MSLSLDNLRLRLAPMALKAWLKPGPSHGLVRLGSSYGGWWVPVHLIKAGAIAYCAGAGEDVSFDLALAGRGCSVWTFDPTPRAISHIASVGDALHFLPIGWWNADTEIRFFAPANPKHVSHSATNLQGTDTYFTAPVRSVASIARELGHAQVSIVKMDIEGAEYTVINSMLSDGLLPQAWCIEFDQPQPLRRVVKAVRRLQAAGYQLRRIEKWNYTFVRTE